MKNVYTKLQKIYNEIAQGILAETKDPSTLSFPTTMEDIVIKPLESHLEPELAKRFLSKKAIEILESKKVEESKDFEQVSTKQATEDQ